MSEKYFSFLVCDHLEQGVKNLFVNGLPIGQIKDGVFEPDLMLLKGLPFAGPDFCDYLSESILAPLRERILEGSESAIQCKKEQSSKDSGDQELARLKRELEEARSIVRVEAYAGPDELRKRCGELLKQNLLLTKERDELKAILSNPDALHTHILRNLSAEQIHHLLGEEAVKTLIERDELKAALSANQSSARKTA